LPHHQFNQVAGDGLCGTWALELSGTMTSWPEYIALSGAPDDYPDRAAPAMSEG